MDFTGAVAMFLTDAAARNLAPRTCEYYRWQLEKFNTWLLGEGAELAHLDSLTPALIRAYLVSLRQRGLKDSSVHAAARAIRALSNFCECEGLLQVSPMRKVKMPKVARRILPALSAGAVATLLGACETPRDRAIVLFLLDSGCRAAELVALNVGDVDAHTGVVRIWAGKGAKDRVTAIEDVTRAALAGYLAERGRLAADAPLWVTSAVTGGHWRNGRRAGAGAFCVNVAPTDKRLTRQGLTEILKRLGRRAGVKASPHAFRRTCALSMHRSGARLTEIAALLGHSDLPTLQKYLDLQNQDAVNAHRKHSPVAALLADSPAG